MSATSPVDPVLCPLCGQANQCAMEVARATGQKQPPCWCSRTRFEAELLARIPEHARGTACICVACAQGDAPRTFSGKTTGLQPD